MANSKIKSRSLEADAVDAAAIEDLAITSGKLAATQDLSTKTITLPASVSGLGTGITNSQLAGSIDVTTKITGTIPTANLGSGSASSSTYLAGDQTYKTISEYDDDAIQNDIATLALHQATNANAAKYSLTNTNVDVYQDSTGVASFTDCARVASGEYVASVYSSYGDQTVVADATGTAIGTMSGNAGLGACFDGSNNQAYTAGCGITSAVQEGFIGKDWGDGNTKLISGFKAWSSNNDGWFSANPSTGKIVVYGNTTDNTGTAISLGETATFNFRQNFNEQSILTGLTTTTAYRYHWINIYKETGNDNWLSCAEVQFYEDPLESTANATGSYISTATTANASVSSMGAVITYKNEVGTNTLNTDIVLEVSADGGSNYTTATLVAGGTFSTGVLQAVANDISVTAGTSIQYRISFANQALVSKVAQIHGASLMY